MKNVRVGVEYGLAIDIGDAWVRACATIEGDLEPGEELDVAYLNSWKTVTSQVLKKIKRTKKRMLVE